MTPDEMKRTMEFIVEQQSQFASDIQQLKERQEKFQKQQEKFQLQQEKFQKQQEKFQLQQETFEQRHVRFQGDLERLTAVATTALETSTKTMEVVLALSQGQSKLADTQAKTQRQLTRLATLLAQHISTGHGPGSTP